ncbi:MAG: hypothetical protein GF317_15975 [Candidatus Lokiarchaeota archaeon]|nr:hypothetical protein [Candidatus Lokiarchaeota archaeon]
MAGKINTNFPNQNFTLLFVLGLVAFCIFFLYRNQYSYGDALIYADNILKLRFGDISIHWGYYCLGLIFHLILGSMGLTIDNSLVIMSNVFGAVCVSYSYLFFRKFQFDKKSSIIGSLMLLFAGVFFSYSIQAEVYIPQLAFLLASMYYYMSSKPAVSGILFGIALLITPLSIFTLPFYIFIFIKERLSIKNAFYFILPSIIIYLPVFAFVHEDLLWGRRGLLSISAGMGMNTFQIIIVNTIFAFGKSFHVLLPFALFGLIYSAMKNRFIFALFSIILAGNLFLFVKLNRDDLTTAMLPVFVFLIILAILGLNRINLSISSWIGNKNIFRYAVLAMYILINAFIWIGPSRLPHPRILNDRSYQEALINFANRTTDDVLFIASFWHGVAYSFYTRSDIEEELETTMGNNRWLDIEDLDKDKWAVIKRNYEEIYIQEAYSPSSAAKLLLSDSELKTRYEQNSIKARIAILDGEMGFIEFAKTDDIWIYKAKFPGY